MKKTFALAVLLLTVPPAFSTDGAIPIWTPTVIAEPGRYVVTRNIFTPGFAIVVESSDVVVDLNGFHLACEDPGATACVLIAPGLENITIENGTIGSATYGIYMYVLDSFLHRVTIRDLTITTAVAAIAGGPGLDQVRILDNNIRGALGFNGIFFNGGTGTEIRGNNVDSMVVSGEGMTIADNTVPNAFGFGVYVIGNHNRIAGNTVTGAGQGGGGGDGILVSGYRNLVENNQTSGNVNYGLAIMNDENVYRGNIARGNGGTTCTGTASGGDFCDEGSNNTSHGDNYMPGPM